MRTTLPHEDPCCGSAAGPTACREQEPAEEARVGDGDRGFADFVAAEQAALLRLAVLLSGDRGHAEDLVQTALLKTYRHWDRISRSGPPSAYVRRVLVTTHASWRRRLSTTEQVVESVPGRAGARGPGALRR